MQTVKTNLAATEYANHASDVSRLLDVLQMEIDAKDDRQKADQKNWGHAGDMQAVKNKLAELICTISDKCMAEVFEFLADDEA